MAERLDSDIVIQGPQRVYNRVDASHEPVMHKVSKLVRMMYSRSCRHECHKRAVKSSEMAPLSALDIKHVNIDIDSPCIW